MHCLSNVPFWSIINWLIWFESINDTSKYGSQAYSVWLLDARGRENEYCCCVAPQKSLLFCNETRGSKLNSFLTFQVSASYLLFLLGVAILKVSLATKEYSFCNATFNRFTYQQWRHGKWLYIILCCLFCLQPFCVNPWVHPHLLSVPLYMVHFTSYLCRCHVAFWWISAWQLEDIRDLPRNHRRLYAETSLLGIRWFSVHGACGMYHWKVPAERLKEIKQRFTQGFHNPLWVANCGLRGENDGAVRRQVNQWFSIESVSSRKIQLTNNAHLLLVQQHW